jgi:hypothetical protein
MSAAGVLGENNRQWSRAADTAPSGLDDLGHLATHTPLE